MRCVIVSAYGDMENIRTAMNRGAFDFVTKPLDFEDLKVTIDRTLRHLAEWREALASRDKLVVLQNELQLASKMQQSILPTRFPEGPDFRIHGHMESARAVGGDFFDVMALENGRIGLAIADVSDKGVPASLFMMSTRTLLKGAAVGLGDPGEVLCEVNDLLNDDNEASMFVTVFYATYDPASGAFTYANGGHNSPLLVHADGSSGQDQIVVREKLAALGELTAGVAHEIRNPLNFVKNFSEASEELIDELKEVLEESGEKLDDEQRSLLAEISGDLVDNLGRIRSHGDRANRIVHDMLMMGRHSAEVLKVEVNGLLEEYARLAYHSSRASDPEFQLDMQFDLDPQMGELEVIPQDLGRVFLNMVANACDATDEKRRGGGPGEQEGSPYEPTLWIASKRDEERAVIRIKDNADGMPPEIVEKIFTPFFTTKPAGKGTGLGLAMSADIVREHGGTIQVNSEPGRFTEMVIDLPLEPPAKLGVGEQEP